MKDYWWVILFIAVLLVYNFLLGAFCTWLFCLAFGFKFTWGRAFVFWFIFLVLTGGARFQSKK